MCVCENLEFLIAVMVVGVNVMKVVNIKICLFALKVVCVGKIA